MSFPMGNPLQERLRGGSLAFFSRKMPGEGACQEQDGSYLHRRF
jgi:hypothetical protein